MNQGKQALEVLVFGPAGFVGSFVFTAPRISIGRDADSMVRLDAPEVSAKHAELVLAGGLFRLRDLGSRTGTRVNGVPVLPRQPLEPDDEVSIGNFRLRITLCDPDGLDEPKSRESVRPAPAPARVSTPARVPPPTRPPPLPRTLASPPPLPAIAPSPRPVAATASVAAVTPVVPVTPPPVVVPVPPVGPAAPLAPAASLEPAAEVPSLAFGTFDPAPAPRDGDDDDDDDENFVPPFDLLEALARGGLHDERAKPAAEVCLEVIRCRLDRVVSVRHAEARGRLRLDSTPALGSFESTEAFSLSLGACRVAAVREGGRTLTDAEVLSKHDGVNMRVTRGMMVSVHVEGGDELLIHWVPRAAALQAPRLSLRPSAAHARTGALSVALHLVLLAFIGLVLIGEKKADVELNAGRFARVDVRELELEPPPPAPPPAPELQPTADAPSAPTAPVKPEPASRSRLPLVKGARASARDASPASQATQRILSALGGVPASTGAISISNLDALPVGAGDFKVSGALGKAPGDTLRVAAGGGSEPETKSASELGGSSLGKLQARGSGSVRARVTASPQAIRGEGTLDRAEIQKVVNAHLYQIQGCYERQLARDPSLSGKIFFDWVVGLSGAVSSVRVGRSTIQSVEVTTCIQSVIQGWKFPSPQGGTVTVTYPFAFSSFGG